MTNFRISLRVGNHRAAGWFSGADANEAIAQAQRAYPGASITAVTKRCGAPIPKRRGIFYGHVRFATCQRLTADERCHLHDDALLGRGGAK